MKPKHRVLLVILDGWGIRSERAGNAILLAGTPHLDRISQGCPRTELQTSGLAVGLPEGQMGNSEVGHTNIGAGRIVYQDLVRINRACDSGDIRANPVIQEAMDLAKSGQRTFHLLGLVSPGGVHSSTEHLLCLLRLAKAQGLSRVFIHAFLDGRDTPPQSAQGYISELDRNLVNIGIGQIATVSGRYFAMDRDQRWDRIHLAFDALVHGKGPRAPNATAAVQASYQGQVTDEFVHPTVIARGGAPLATMQDGDVAFFFNFRADRARQLTRALADPNFKEFDRGTLRLARFVCMTQYDQRFTDLPVAFPPEQPMEIFPEVLAEHGLRQFRTAETEKYAHVTFFFNGGRELVYPGEDRLLIPSPRDVKTYDHKPEMSAREVTAKLIQRIQSDSYDFALVNFANPDMVGHTGVLDAAISAVKVVDECLGGLGAACAQSGWLMAITADHGNCEMMIDPMTGKPHTAHTLNPVPFYLIHPDLQGKKLRSGILADIAPTLLKVMELPQPAEMQGQSLLEG